MAKLLGKALYNGDRSRVRRRADGPDRRAERRQPGRVRPRQGRLGRARDGPGRSCRRTAWPTLRRRPKATLGEPSQRRRLRAPEQPVDRGPEARHSEGGSTRSSAPSSHGVAVRGVDQPYRTGAPTRMQIAQWANTKENVNEVYGSYSSTLVTLARILDISKQYARFSGRCRRDRCDGPSWSSRPCSARITTSSRAAAPAPARPRSRPACLHVADRVRFRRSPPRSPARGLEHHHRERCQGVLADALGAHAAQPASRRRSSPTRSPTRPSRPRAPITAGFWLSPAGGPGDDPDDRERLPGDNNITGGLEFWGCPVYWDANYNTNTWDHQGPPSPASGTHSSSPGLRVPVSKLGSGRRAVGRNRDWGLRGEEEIGVHAGTAVGHRAPSSSGVNIIP